MTNAERGASSRKRMIAATMLRRIGHEVRRVENQKGLWDAHPGLDGQHQDRLQCVVGDGVQPGEAVADQEANARTVLLQRPLV